MRYLTSYLKRHQFDADMIQGEMTQAAREHVMARIKAAQLRFLVATDVAARGIDISDLSHVISYSAPGSPEIYLHRTGRTGRLGKAGIAISLVSGLDIGSFRNLQTVNRLTIPERHVPDDEEALERLAQRVLVRIEHDLRERGERERDLRQTHYGSVLRRLVDTEEGQQALSAMLFEYLRDPRRAEGEQAEVPEERGRGEEPPRSDPGPRRRRRRRRREPGAGER